MAFKHGTSTREEPSKASGFLSVATPVLLIGMAPVNMATDASINKLELIQNQTEAVQKFGSTTKIDGYSISEFLSIAFNVIKVLPVLCINVLDPSKHFIAVDTPKTQLDPLENLVTIEAGLIEDSLKVNKTDTSEPLTISGAYNLDGTYSFEITSDITGITEIDITYNKLDPSKVTELDIIGSIDPITLEKSGMELIADSMLDFSMIPLVNLAPDFTTSTMRAALDTKTSKISNKWLSGSFVDLPEDTKYGEAIKFKKDENWIDEDQMVCFGKAKFGEGYYSQAIFAAQLFAEQTSLKGGTPCESPSNKNIRATGIAYKDVTEYKDIKLDEDQANVLNASGISTILQRTNGTVFWGNRTSIFQPGSTTDPKDIFLTFKYMFKWIANTLMINTDAEVDKGMTVQKATSIMTNINTFLASLTNAQKLYGARVEFNIEENPNIAQGQFVWHIFVGNIYPGESLEFVLEHDGSYAEVSLASIN